MIVPKKTIPNRFNKPEYAVDYHVQHKERIGAETITRIEQNVEDFEQEFETNVKAEERKPSNKKVNLIISVTGDDKAIAGTNRYVTGVFLVMPRVLFGIDIVSRVDTGINKSLCNYTEGYIMHAPHRNATFDTVRRKYANCAMPMVFDTLKLKQFLPNTKGNFGRVDLADKLKQASKQVEWMHDFWIGKFAGELMKVISWSLFDFRNARTFPLLYETEGGCGGKPPFNNLGTLKNALHFFRGGKAKEGILNVMAETTAIQQGKLSPQKGVFTQAMHIAQSGTSPEQIYGFFTNPGFTSLRAEDKEQLLDDLAGRDPLPAELLKVSELLEPDNKLTGAIVSELRSKGHIMTELDVRMAIAGRRKFEALLGNREMEEVLQEIDLEKRKAKSQPWKNIMAHGMPVYPCDRDLESTAAAYYQTRSNRADITGFSYAGRIRVFKTADVKRILQIDSYGLADEVISALPSRNEYGEGMKYGRERTKHILLKDTMKKNLKQIFTQPDPGVGPDDARIALRALQIPAEEPLFVITDDRRLMEILPSIHRKTHRITVQEYLNSWRSGRTPVPWGLSVVGPTYWLGRSSHGYPKVHVPAMDQYRPKVKDRLKTKAVKAHLCYDFANINRRIEATSSGQGFFSLKSAQDKLYGELPWEDFVNLPDFTQTGLKFRNVIHGINIF